MNPHISLVMSFPFWNLDGKYIYFSEIIGILEKWSFEITPLLPDSLSLTTRTGSLLYRRDAQTVGREIIHITPKSR